MADLARLVDELSSLTVLEAAELSKMLEEKWGVSAAAPVAVAAAPAAGGAAAAAPAEEQTEFTVTAEYTDGEWIYKSYRATTLNTEDQTTNTVQHDATRIAPPVLIGILGLKTADYSPPSSR